MYHNHRPLIRLLSYQENPCHKSKGSLDLELLVVYHKCVNRLFHSFLFQPSLLKWGLFFSCIPVVDGVLLESNQSPLIATLFAFTPLISSPCQISGVFCCKNLLLTSGTGSSNIIIHRVAYSVLTPPNGVEKLNRHTRTPLYPAKGQFVWV